MQHQAFECRAGKGHRLGTLGSGQLSEQRRETRLFPPGPRTAERHRGVRHGELPAVNAMARGGDFQNLSATVECMRQQLGENYRRSDAADGIATDLDLVSESVRINRGESPRSHLTQVE